MKRLIVILSAVLALCSCTPQTYALLYDMHYPGQAGFVLGNKTMSIVYLNNSVKSDSLYLNNLSKGFARGLEKEYFENDDAVPIFCIDKDMSGQYASKDSLINIMLDTDSDVLFLFDSPTKSQANGTIKERSYLYVYDSMNKQRDSVVAVYLEHDIASTDIQMFGATDYGRQIASLFEDDFRTEYYSLFYYTDIDNWVNALSYATEEKWDKAMEIWMTSVADSGNIEKQACAAYNLATACYFLEDYDLALEWLDACDGYYNVGSTDALRKRIKQMSGK